MTQVEIAKAAALDYARWGYNPLPSRGDEKRPAIYFRKYRDAGPSTTILDQWRWPNIQVVCGVRWRLAVIDLDGDQAVDTWRCLTLFRPDPPTWKVRSRRGYHLWYTLPEGLGSLPSGWLWRLWDHDARDGKGDWARGEGIELLADLKLAVAPPSLHPKTGQPYRWADGTGPGYQERPAPIPGWILRLPAVRTPARVSTTVETFRAKRTVSQVPSLGLPWRDVSAAIPDKLSLAVEWGLRPEGDPNHAGWVRCHAIGRRDEHPSAGFNVHSGYYCEPGEGLRLSLFSLAESLGAYRSWQSACDHLGLRAGLRPSPPKRAIA